MNLATLKLIEREIAGVAIGQRFGRVFQPSRHLRLIDLQLPGQLFLLVATDPADPKAFLARRRFRDLDKASLPPTPFDNALRTELSGLVVTGVGLIEGERVIHLDLAGEDGKRTLIVQLTGRSANLFVTDASRKILARERKTLGDGQEIGTVYAPPQRPGDRPAAEGEPFPVSGFATLSEALDARFQLDAEHRKATEAAKSSLAKINKELERAGRLLRALRSDREQHGDASVWKRYGDLLLANISTARLEDERAIVIDYFEDGAPEISIDIDAGSTVTEAAEKYFRKYAKARNAAVEIEKRIVATEELRRSLEARRSEIETAIAAGDAESLRAFVRENVVSRARPPASPRSQKSHAPTADAIARRFTSTDGYEILVGKKAKDNDLLTFRIARSSDIWLHAADYPGSHVVVRNPTRKDLPHRTLVEAARLAAFYSQGNKQVKAAVNYTEKKFVNKRKGMAPGLVSMATFKTILVEPTIPDGITRG